MDVWDLRDNEPSLLMYGGRAGRKDGILIDGAPWIAKYPRTTRDLTGKNLPSYTSSPVSEYVGSHIYSLLGIPAHETLLGYRGGKIVCACRDFTADGSRLFEFSKVKTTMDDDQEGFHGSPSDGEVVYLSDVLATIDTAPVLAHVPGVRERFWDMFVVDALIKNPDRNNGNWGVLLRDGAYELAPVYDNGSCLFPKRADDAFGRRTDPQALDEDAFGTNVSAYVLMGDDGRPHHIHPFAYMAESANPDLRAAMARVAAAFDFGAVERLFMSLPSEAYGWRVMSEPVREANLRLIEKRFDEGLRPLV